MLIKTVQAVQTVRAAQTVSHNDFWTRMKNTGTILFQEAEKHRKAARYREAVKLYKDALKYFKKESDIAGMLDCVISLADTFRAKGEFIKAREYYEEGLELADILGDKSSRADSLAGLGLCWRALGDWKDALDLIGSRVVAVRFVGTGRDQHGKGPCRIGRNYCVRIAVRL